MPQDRPRRPWIAPVLSLAVLLVLVEAGAWVAGAFLPAAAADADADVVAPDVRAAREQAGLGMRDGSMSLHPYFGYVFTPPPPDAPPGPLAISEDGFLDERPLVRERDESRLLVGITGGSVAGQLGSFHSDALRRALRERAGIDDRAIEFVRLGMPGYHQPQQLHQLAWLLAQGGELDVLVNLDGFNEVAVPAALNAPRGTHPLFPMNWSMVALDVPDLGVRRDIGAIAFLRDERVRRATAFEDSWRSWSALGRLLHRLDDRRLTDAIARHRASLAAFEPGETPWFVRGPERDHAPEGGLVPWCVEVWKRSSLQMHALCEANGIRYLHVLQPNQYLPGSKPLSAAERETAYLAESPYRAVVEEGYPLLRAAGAELRAAGVAFVDLSALFETVEQTLYVDNCCHFNGLGNELVSAAIAQALAG